MTYKILFAGIDGSGKTSCLQSLISRLEKDYGILKIGNCDPYLYFKGKKTLLLRNNWYKIIAHMRMISLKYHIHGVFLIFNFIYKYLLSKYLERNKETDLIMYESDTLLHPTVYITYHFPWTKRVHASSRFRIVHTLFGEKDNFLIFYLDTEPSIAVERIRRRNIDIQSHENNRDLGILRAEFESILKVAARRGLDIIKINTSEKSMEEVTSEMETAIRERVVASG